MRKKEKNTGERPAESRTSGRTKRPAESRTSGRTKRPAEWIRLDNAAKIFPPTSNRRETRVFRFACQLREPVDPVLLQAALDKTVMLFPMWQTVLRHGLFWYYLEKSEHTPLCEQEHRPICGPIYEKNSDRLLFEVSYYGSRINLEAYHALTDGTGALHFLQTLVCLYLKQAHPGLPDLLPMLAKAELTSVHIPGDEDYYNATIRGMMVLVPDLDACREVLAEALQ